MQTNNHSPISEAYLVQCFFFLHLAKSGHFGLLYLKLIFSTIGQNFS